MVGRMIGLARVYRHSCCCVREAAVGGMHICWMGHPALHCWYWMCVVPAGRIAPALVLIWPGAEERREHAQWSHCIWPLGYTRKYVRTFSVMQ